VKSPGGETLVLQTFPRFWNLIEKRRRQKTISLGEMVKGVAK
jgi:hypothetical protein